MRRLIDADALRKEIDLCDIDTFTDKQTICEQIAEAPTVDAVVVEDPKLLKAIKLLIKQYAHSKASDYVHSPVAHALYHTWKQVDEGR